jgi:mannitol-specific phosphotransferase system IIBC component
LNLYGYADGAPINNVDPFGLYACREAALSLAFSVAAEALVLYRAARFAKEATEVAVQFERYAAGATRRGVSQGSAFAAGQARGIRSTVLRSQVGAAAVSLIPVAGLILAAKELSDCQKKQAAEEAARQQREQEEKEKEKQEREEGEKEKYPANGSAAAS